MSRRVPTQLKIVTGNPGKRPMPKNEPKPAVARSIKPLPWLSAEAKKEWRRVAPELERVGLLTEVDIALLAAYCDAFGDFQRDEKAMAKLRAEAAGVETNETPNGMVQQHALRGMKRVARADLVKFCHEFGMTPTARSGMDVHIGRSAAAPEGGQDKPAKSKFFGD